MTGVEVASALGTEAAKVVVSDVTKRVLDTALPVPPDQRPGFAAVQPLVIESSKMVTRLSASVLDLLEPFHWGETSLDRSVLEQRYRQLAGRSTEARETTAAIAPMLAGMRSASRRAIPRLEPVTASALNSAVRWYGWASGALLDITEEADTARVTENPPADAPPFPPERLARILLYEYCIERASATHSDLQQAASEAAMSAVGADARAFRRAERKQKDQDDTGRELWARMLERSAETLEDVVSSPTRATRLRRAARKA